MQRIWCLAVITAVGLAAIGSVPAAAPQGKDDPIELKLVAKKDTYAWDGGGMTPKDYRKMLDKLADDKEGFGKKMPPAPEVDLVLQIINKSKEDVTVYVAGSPNLYTFELKGPGAVTLRNPVAFPAIFKSPKAQTLKPGESYDIPVSKLMDGQMGMARLVYWAEPGDYTLSATYQMADAKGGKSTLLKSEPVKLKVEMPK